MISRSQINKAVSLLNKAVDPTKIILFGSYARNQEKEESDVDFLVILSEVKNKYKEMVYLKRVLRPLHIPVDVLVFSKQEVEDWGHLPGTVLYWALKEGKVVHEKAL